MLLSPITSVFTLNILFISNKYPLIYVSVRRLQVDVVLFKLHKLWINLHTLVFTQLYNYVIITCIKIRKQLL